MKARLLLPAAVCAALALLPLAADAHPSFQPREARIGAPYRAAIRIPHGCDGSATVRLRVQAGENWDDLVAWTVEQGFSGFEALSGILLERVGDAFEQRPSVLELRDGRGDPRGGLADVDVDLDHGLSFVCERGAKPVGTRPCDRR